MPSPLLEIAKNNQSYLSERETEKYFLVFANIKYDVVYH